MKKLFSIFILLFLIGCAPIPIEERQSEIILNELGKNKDELFDISLEWLAKVFIDSKSVIKMKDKERGKIVGKGYMIVSGRGRLGITYNLTISVKDNRIRMEFGDYGMYDFSPLPTSERWALEKAKQKSSQLSEELELYIKNYSNSDW